VENRVSSVIVELLHGKHAHADGLVCVDVAAETAARRPAGLPHSIWQLVWHMNYWMDYELRRIAGLAPPYPEHAALGWPTGEPPSGEAWRGEVTRFTELLGRLETLARGSPRELDRSIPSPDRRAGAAYPLEAVLWQTLVHNSYHLGQVVQVRQALGDWPPERGSDTW
jgi:hypothetical protein